MFGYNSGAVPASWTTVVPLGASDPVANGSDVYAAINSILGSAPTVSWAFFREDATGVILDSGLYIITATLTAWATTAGDISTQLRSNQGNINVKRRLPAALGTHDYDTITACGFIAPNDYISLIVGNYTSADPVTILSCSMTIVKL